MLMNRGSNVSSWLTTVLTAPDKLRPLYPQQPTFAGRCPLSCRFRPLIWGACCQGGLILRRM